MVAPIMVRAVAADTASGDNGPMASWGEVVEAAPELAEAVRVRFAAGKHCTLATLRRDGSPRISGTEVEFAAGELWIGSMSGARKLADLRRDPRMALHSPSTDPPDSSPSDWAGEAKVAGRAVAGTPPPAEPGDEAGDAPVDEAGDAPVDAGYFRLDLDEVVLTRVVGDELEITSWHPGRGVETHRRT